jgi:hypothetical protein
VTEGVLVWNGRAADPAPVKREGLDGGMDSAENSARADAATVGHADLHASPLARGGGDAHRSAGRLDADALRGEADMTLC